MEIENLGNNLPTSREPRALHDKLACYVANVKDNRAISGNITGTNIEQEQDARNSQLNEESATNIRTDQIPPYGSTVSNSGV